MENHLPHMNQAMIIDALRLHIAFGADENIVDEPINHYQINTQPSVKASPPIHEVENQDTFHHDISEPTKSGQTATTPSDSRVFAAPPQAPLASSSAYQTEELAKKAQTVAELQNILETFEGSTLKRSAKNTVFSDGTLGSRVMLIGEAPGREEDRTGKPFIGQSGQMLDQMFAAIGLDRNTVYITNLIPWRPAGDRTPTDDEIALFLPFLKQHITLAKPDIIVTIGAVSSKALLDTDVGITKMRGQWGVVSDNNDRKIPVLPTFHPAFLLRTPTRKAESWADLCALRAWLNRETPENA